jgi:hypothetical protein
MMWPVFRPFPFYYLLLIFEQLGLFVKYGPSLGRFDSWMKESKTTHGIGSVYQLDIGRSPLQIRLTS